MEGPLSDDTLRNWPSLVLEDTSRSLPKRITWLLDNQRRVVAPDWESSATCLSAGLCVAMVPVHFARPRIDTGECGIEQVFHLTKFFFQFLGFGL